MSVASYWFLAAFMMTGVICDVRTRRMPNSLILAGLLFGATGDVGGWWDWHWLWMAGAAVPLLVVEMPSGDVKATMILGGVLGPLIGVVVLGAMGILFLLLLGYWARWWTWPGDQPFFPYLAGLTCGTVIGTWV